jgi:hypothetical protein
VYFPYNFHLPIYLVTVQTLNVSFFRAHLLWPKSGQLYALRFDYGAMIYHHLGGRTTLYAIWVQIENSQFFVSPYM